VRRGICTHTYKATTQVKGKAGLIALNKHKNIFLEVKKGKYIRIDKIPEKDYDIAYKGIKNIFSDNPCKNALTAVINPKHNYFIFLNASGHSIERRGIFG
jgi:hypothetical protein